MWTTNSLIHRLPVSEAFLLPAVRFTMLVDLEISASSFWCHGGFACRHVCIVKPWNVRRRPIWCHFAPWHCKSSLLQRSVLFSDDVMALLFLWILTYGKSLEEVLISDLELTRIIGALKSESLVSNHRIFQIELTFHVSYFEQGAIMAVGASTPTVVATGNGLFGVKNRMTVTILLWVVFFWCLCPL